MADEPNANGGDTSQGNGAPEALTRDEINKLVNSAITSHLKRSEEKQAASLAKIIEEQFGKITESLKPPEQTGKSPASDPETNALKKQLDEQAKLTKQLLQERDAERQAARDLKLRQTVTDHLVATGIDPSRAKHALAFLVDGEKRVAYDGDSIVFRDDSGAPLPIVDGLKSWVKGADAKLYLPPAGGGGTGTNQGSQGSQGGKNDSSAGTALLNFVTGNYSVG